MEEYSLKTLPYLALILGLGFIITSVLGQVTSDIKVDQDISNTTKIGNESITVNMQTTGNNFSVLGTVSSSVSSIFEVWNATNPGASTTKVGAGNYSFLANGTFILLNERYNNTALNVTYVVNNKNLGTLASNLTGKAQAGITKFGDWFPTIGLIVGAIIVLGVLAMMFPTLRGFNRQ